MVDQAINFGQEIQNFSDITLKEKQYEVLKLLVVEEKDVLAVLPTGYGKSSTTSVKFYELRRNIQRPTLVCARHFAIKCFDSRLNFNDEKGNSECLCFKRRSVEWGR